MDPRLLPPPADNTVDIALIPKVELHVHFEATMTIELVKQLAEKYQIALPGDLFTEDGKKIAWTNFTKFLTQYDAASKVVCSKEAITLIAYDYLRRSHKQGVIYTELTVSPQHIALFGQAFKDQSFEATYNDVMSAVKTGIDQARAEFGIEARILVVMVRHLPIKSSEELIDIIIRNQGRHPDVVGIGLAGDEVNYQPYLFSEIFAKARKSGLRCTAHAGEWTHASDVRNAEIALSVTRIGHGIHAAFDPDTLDWLKKDNIHLELCLHSNMLLNTKGNYPAEYQDVEHPVTLLDRAGISFSLSTDDPLFFGNNMNEEYALAQRLLKCGAGRLLSITLDGIEASFAPVMVKMLLREKVAAFAKEKNVQVLPRQESRRVSRQFVNN